MPRASNPVPLGEFLVPDHHNVLIVEDDAAIRDVFAEVLGSAGHEVMVARNGAEAMSLLLDGVAPPCLIVADLLMPVLDGWGLAAAIALKPGLAAIPLIVLSAQLSSGDNPIPPGARARFTKPISIDALLDIVEGNCALTDRGASPPIIGRQPA